MESTKVLDPSDFNKKLAHNLDMMIVNVRSVKLYPFITQIDF